MDFYALGSFILIAVGCFFWFVAWLYPQLCKDPRDSWVRTRISNSSLEAKKSKEL